MLTYGASTFKKRYPTSYWNDHFKPKNYLRTFYSRPTVCQDELMVLHHQRIFFNNKFFRTCLDIGSGPTVHHALALEPFVGSLVLTDYLTENVYEVQKWLEKTPHHHDWSVYTKAILSLETCRTPSSEDILKRENDTRNKIALGRVDIFSDTPLSLSPDAPKKYDLVTSFFCPDSITNSLAEYRKMIVRILGVLNRKGSFFITALAETDSYKVLGKNFPSPNLTYTELFDSLLLAGANRESLNISYISVPEMKNDGYTHILVATGTI